MKTLTLTFILSVLVFFAYPQGFSSTHIDWSTPIGGYYSGSTNYGYNVTNGNSGGNNSESWSLIDMDGDNKPDLVVTSIGIGSGSHQQFGVGASPYWKVYLNTGSGMSPTPIIWSTPIGGYYSGSTNYGYSYTNGNSGGNNSESWALTDMDGDNKPDLVVTGIGIGSGSHFQFDVGVNPYWKVYLNTGSGMSSTAINWVTPIGGYYSGSVNYGYNITNGNSGGNNSESWSLTDMDGDNKPDLVVTGIGIGSGSHFQFDVGVNPFWKVYLNTGSGMSSTAINWVTPIGGYYSGSVNYGYNTTNGNSGGNNSESWSLTDMDGDNKPDLVVTSIGIGSGSHQQFGVGASPFWKVYFNTGVGMSTTVLNWSTPLGGYFSGTTNYGYNDIYGSAGGNNSESWALADMDGDNKPELIVSSIGTGSGSHFQFGVGASPYWKVHFNNGSGMSSTAVNWSTPIGGYYSGSTNYGYNDIFGNSGGNNSESWEITDMNGDNEPDLVVTSVGVGSGSHFQFDVGVNPYWKVYLNVGITGIVANQKENFPISIYPNPCIDNFTLETNAVSVGTIFSIVDVLGKKLFDLQITNSKCYVDFRNAKSGIYFLQTNNNSIKAQKIIKQ